MQTKDIEVKDLSKVEIGEIALHADSLEPLGEIVWKGKFWKGFKKHQITLSERYEWEGEFSKKELKKLDVVFVNTKKYGRTLLTYNFNSRSAIVEDSKPNEIETSLKIVMMSHLSDSRQELEFISNTVELTEDAKEWMERVNKRLNFLSYLISQKVDKKMIYPETEFEKFENL